MRKPYKPEARARGVGDLRDLAVVRSLAGTWALSGQMPFWRRSSQLSPSLALQAFMTRVASLIASFARNRSQRDLLSGRGVHFLRALKKN